MKLSRSFRTTHYLFFLLFSLWLAYGIPATLSAQNINFPDANFKQALIDAGVDTGMDGEISQAEAGAVTGLDVSFKNISDLTGIMYFTSLDTLDCSYNNLPNLNVSGLSSLEFLNCGDNAITSLDVSTLSSLKTLGCFKNSLTSLDVSGLTSLEFLDCYNNSLTSLDVSALTSLEVLVCSDNSLTSLDVSELTNLQLFSCFNNSL